MLASYHSHTRRCGHAKGTEEETIIKAISEGFDIIGISDHIPLRNSFRHIFPSFIEYHNFRMIKSGIKYLRKRGFGMRMPYNTMEDYLKSMRDLKKKYEGQIKVYCAFETEYFEDQIPFYKELLTKKRVDYLIYGNHFHKYSLPGYYSKANNPEQLLREYEENIVAAMNSGLFLYIAHPDLFVYYKDVKWNEQCERLTHRICEIAIEKDIILEINLEGLRNNKGYPHDDFWKIASKHGVKTVIGLDSHAIEHVDKKYMNAGIEFARKHNLKLLDSIEI